MDTYQGGTEDNQFREYRRSDKLFSRKERLKTSKPIRSLT